MSWFEKLVPQISNEGRPDGKARSVPEGLWVKCEDCDAVLYRSELERSLQVCPKCGFHMPVGARERLNLFLDADGREEIAAAVHSVDPLKFKDSKRYKDRLTAAHKATSEQDALIVYKGKVLGTELVAAAFEFRFLAGSMGSAVGERFVRAANVALEQRVPFVCFSTSGGARMQEALYSLLQMAKTAAVLKKLSEAGVPYISVMTHPTTGGVSASLAMLGDINLAEPRALIGFAGPRVIEQTVKQKLPEGFQRSEFLLEHGVIDQIVDRREMRERIHRLLTLLANQPTSVDIQPPTTQAA